MIIDVTWRAVEAFGRATGRSMPEPSEREPTVASWEPVAVEAGFDGFTGLFRALCETVPDEMIDPASITLLGDARAAGRRTGVLSNDAYTFVGREFFAGRPEFAELDAFVDAADIGVRKPHPDAYLRGGGRTGVQPGGRVPRRHAGVRRRGAPGRHDGDPRRSARQDPGLRSRPGDARL